MLVTQYKKLRGEDIQLCAEPKVYIQNKSSNYAFEKDLYRVWFCNLVNSLVQEDFAAFIVKRYKQTK